MNPLLSSERFGCWLMASLSTGRSSTDVCWKCGTFLHTKWPENNSKLACRINGSQISLTLRKPSRRVKSPGTLRAEPAVSSIELGATDAIRDPPDPDHCGVEFSSSVAWILLALLIRAFSLLIFYWVIGFSLMFAAGLLSGLVIPWRAQIRGKFAFRQLTPDDVVAGKAFKGRPRGESKHYGWDRAWPMYVPFQARQDAKGVVGEAQILLAKLWARIINGIRFTPKSAGGVLGVALPIPFFGFWAGVWLSIGAWLLAMLALGSWSGSSNASSC